MQEIRATVVNSRIWKQSGQFLFLTACRKTSIPQSQSDLRFIRTSFFKMYWKVYHGRLYGSKMGFLCTLRNKACTPIFRQKSRRYLGVAYSTTYGLAWAIFGVRVTRGLYYQCAKFQNVLPSRSWFIGHFMEIRRITIRRAIRILKKKNIYYYFFF